MKEKFKVEKLVNVTQKGHILNITVKQS